MKDDTCTCGKCHKDTSEHTPSPFLSQNVWLKGLGLLILIVGMYPTLFKENDGIFYILFVVVIGLAIVTYGVKLIKGLFKSIWNS